MSRIVTSSGSSRLGERGLLVVVSGPSGVGKSTLCRAMTSQLPGTTLSVSYTTRPARPGEQNGVDYCYISKSEFEEMIQRGEFVEWAMVYGHLYGTPSSPLQQAMEQGVDVLLDIDAQGAHQIMKRFSDAVYVFLVPPSLDDLYARLIQRGTDSPEEVNRRFQKAREEILNYKAYSYMIYNDNLEKATRELESVILAERIKTARLTDDWLVARGLIDHRPHNFGPTQTPVTS